MKAEPYENAAGIAGYIIWCPGCRDHHTIPVPGTEPGKCWTMTGDTECPTFMPSLHIFCRKQDGTILTICHSWIRDGQIEFLGDSNHKLKGQTVPLPDVPPL